MSLDQVATEALQIPFGMVLADVDLQVVHRLRMAFVVSQRSRSKRTAYPIEDHCCIAFNAVTNGAGQYRAIGGGLQVYGPARFAEYGPVLEERRVDSAEVDECVGVRFRLN